MRFATDTSMSWVLDLAGVMSALPASFVYGTDAVANTYPPVVQGYVDSPGGLPINSAPKPGWPDMGRRPAQG